MRKFSSRNIKYYVSAGLLIFSIMWVSGYVFLLYSSDYSFALNFIKSNQTVMEALGNITSSRPGFVNFNRRFVGGSGTAKFNVVLKGEKTSGVVYVDLEGSEQGWTVKDASLETESGTVSLTTHKD